MIVGIDIGATKTLIGRFSPDGQLLDQHKFMTPRHLEEFDQTLVPALKNLWKDDVKAIGLAAPGTMDYHSNMFTRFGNLSWHDVNFARKLQPYFNVPIIMDNDANIAGLYEAHQLPVLPESVLYLTISTGIGSGLIADGLIDKTLSRSECGQITLEYQTQLRLWEDFASGRAILRDYGKYGHQIEDKKIWQEIGQKIARGLLVVIPCFQPNRVILGGSIGTYFDHYKESMLDFLTAHIASMIPIPVIQMASRPQEAVLYGCYELAREYLISLSAEK